MWKEKEFIEKLEEAGIDTVCFMGSQYKFEDVKVGSIFYFSYAFMNSNGTDDNTIDNAYNFFKFYYTKFSNHQLTDSYEIVQKFKRIEHYKKKYQLAEHCVIKNLRTNELIVLNDNEIDKMFYLYFDTID